MKTKSNYKFLVVDDISEELINTTTHIKKAGHDVVTAATMGEALKVLAKESVDILLTDIHLNGDDEDRDEVKPEGLILLQDVQTLHPDILPLAMSKDLKRSIWDRAIAFGAMNFVQKPVKSYDNISVQLSLAFSRRSLKFNSVSKKLAGLPDHLKCKYPDGVILDEGIRKSIKGLATRPDITLLVSGETGTGKEEIARLLHRERSALAGDIPFVEVNCSHLRGDLAQSKLFGHKKGAFSGATDTTNGLIAEANGGILFLDEFHTLPAQTQTDLLRVLNDGSYQRVGENKTLYSSFQVVVATPKQLDHHASDGVVAMDISMRLMGVKIDLLPLRERKHEIPDLVEIYFAKAGKAMSKRALDAISKKCQGYYWQGNIRLLMQALQVLTMQAEIAGEAYEVKHLPDFPLMRPPREGVAVELDSVEAIKNMVVEGEIPLDEAVALFEKKVIEEAFAKSNSINELIEKLQTSRSTLDNKRKKYGIGLRG